MREIEERRLLRNKGLIALSITIWYTTSLCFLILLKFYAAPWSLRSRVPRMIYIPHLWRNVKSRETFHEPTPTRTAAGSALLLARIFKRLYISVGDVWNIYARSGLYSSDMSAARSCGNTFVSLRGKYRKTGGFVKCGFAPCTYTAYGGFSWKIKTTVLISLIAFYLIQFDNLFTCVRVA